MEFAAFCYCRLRIHFVFFEITAVMNGDVSQTERIHIEVIGIKERRRGFFLLDERFDGLHRFLVLDIRIYD